MTRPRLLLRTGNKFWTIEVPVRGGGWAIPVHGVDAEGFALDPHNEIAPQRERYEACGRAIDRGASFEEVCAVGREVDAKYGLKSP